MIDGKLRLEINGMTPDDARSLATTVGMRLYRHEDGTFELTGSEREMRSFVALACLGAQCVGADELDVPRFNSKTRVDLSVKAAQRVYEFDGYRRVIVLQEDSR